MGIDEFNEANNANTATKIQMISNYLFSLFYYFKYLKKIIKKNYQIGMKAFDIARLFKISKQTINY